MEKARAFVYEQIIQNRNDIGDKINRRGIVFESSRLPPHVRKDIVNVVQEMEKKGLMTDDECLTEKGYNEIYEMGDNPKEKALSDTREYLYQKIRADNIDINEVINERGIAFDASSQYPHVQRNLENVLRMLLDEEILEEKNGYLFLTFSGYEKIYE